jgi:DNA-binding transcriptional MerR regulator
MSEVVEPIALRRKPAAKYIGVSEDTLCRWRDKGLIKPSRIGSVEL